MENGVQISSWKGSSSRPKIGVEQFEEWKFHTSNEMARHGLKRVRVEKSY